MNRKVAFFAPSSVVPEYAKAKSLTHHFLNKQEKKKHFLVARIFYISVLPARTRPDTNQRLSCLIFPTSFSPSLLIP
jgi:hypothetical protein